MFILGNKSKEHMEGVDPKFMPLVLRALQISKIDFGIPSTGGKRTKETQNDLFRLGKSKADGYIKVSKHQLGKALDFYAYVDGKASWEPEHLAQIACAFLQAAIELGVKIKWGGLFRSFTDMPHIQLIED